MNYKRHYLQFNDLVLEGVEETNNSTPFKTNLTSYTYKHGGYSAHKTGFALVSSADVSFTLTIKMKRLPCDVRPFYRDFAVAELAKPGKLWAIQNNTIIWAYAETTNINMPSDTGRDKIDIEVDMSLPEGVWHKADLQRTFLKPWGICDFMDCLDFHEEKPCEPLDDTCCICGKENHPVGCDCCECQELTKDMALCYHTHELQKLYSCDRDVLFKYTCDDKYFDEIGQRFCTDTGGTIAGRFYSNTDIPTRGITIRFSGEVTNPNIEINDVVNSIKGTYTDLTIYPDGTAVHGCEGCEVDVDNWVVFGQYGWEIHQGYNKIVIDTGNCCGMVCAYIEADALTI